MKPYLNTAIIGNGRILAALGSAGELNRLFWPGIDMAQQVDETWPALLSPAFGKDGIRLDDRKFWEHSQEYLADTAVLKTTVKSRVWGIEGVLHDWVVPDRDLLVRYLEITNLSEEALPLVFLYFASLHLNESSQYNATFFDPEPDILFHYRHDTWVAVAGQGGADAFQCGCNPDEALGGNLPGQAMALSPEAGQAWNLGILEPGQKKTAVVYLSPGRSRQETEDHISWAREQGWDHLLQESIRFWASYLGQAYLPQRLTQEAQRVFKRSVIVAYLLMNRETGGIIAAPEVDEHFSRCGGYAYCWGRDAAFTAHAMLKAGYPEYAKSFYRWAAQVQEADGFWLQRYYTDGRPAPAWGHQIDSTGVIIWGMVQYYKETWDREFLEEIWPSLRLGGAYLLAWTADTSDQARMSWDLWEERFGEHAYSWAAVYAGLKAAGQAAKIMGEPNLGLPWLEASMALQKQILEHFWDPAREQFVRSGWVAVQRSEFVRQKGKGARVREVTGPKGYVSCQVWADPIPDASLLGLTVPFGVLLPGEPKMVKTVKHLAAGLTNPVTGGMMRYQGDTYIGGHPWVLTSLWLGLFEAAAGNRAGGDLQLDWAVRHANGLGLLPEQADAGTGEPAWVIPLAWSHAMFLLLVNLLSEDIQVSESTACQGAR